MTDDVHGSFSAEVRHPDGTWKPFGVTALYRPSDPYAVEFTFYTGGEPRVWLLARELMRDGLYGLAGEGDVLMWPAPAGRPGLMLHLRPGPRGSEWVPEPGELTEALIRLPLDEVRKFFTRTLEAVPEGTERCHFNIDAELEGLLEEES